MGCSCQTDGAISVIQGDVLEAHFTVPGIPIEAIKAVYFNSRKADLYVECPYSTYLNAYCMRLCSDATELLKPMFGTYDLTVELIDGNILTVSRECDFTVFKKRNAPLKEE